MGASQGADFGHISIHALLAESDLNDAINGCNPDIISIHALLAESDILLLCPSFMPSQISIHALLAESDNDITQKRKINPAFLSTLSLRRATLWVL